MNDQTSAIPAPSIRDGSAAGHFVLMGPFGFGNLGDAAIQDTVIGEIRTRHPHATISAISLNPIDTEMRHGIAAFPIRRRSLARSSQSGTARKNTPASQAQKRSYLVTALAKLPVAKYLKPWYSRGTELMAEARFVAKSFRSLRGCTHLVISGGGQLDDVWGGAWAHPYALFKWSVLAKLNRTKLIFLSVGAGPLESVWSRHFVRAALRLADYRSFRDRESRAFVGRLGFANPGPVFPDLAFNLNRVFPATPAHASPLTVSIGPIPYCDPRAWPTKAQAAYDGYVEKVAQFSTWLLEQGHIVRLLPGCIQQDRVPILDISARIHAGATPQKTKNLIIPDIQDVAGLLAEIEASDLVISSRFHGLLLALAARKPADIPFVPRENVCLDAAFRSITVLPEYSEFRCRRSKSDVSHGSRR